MTIRQAARRGIQEAIKWLEDGIEPSPPAYVPMPSFRPPPGFIRTNALDVPMSIQLSMQPLGV